MHCFINNHSTAYNNDYVTDVTLLRRDITTTLSRRDHYDRATDVAPLVCRTACRQAVPAQAPPHYSNCPSIFWRHNYRLFVIIIDEAHLYWPFLV